MDCADLRQDVVACKSLLAATISQAVDTIRAFAESDGPLTGPEYIVLQKEVAYIDRPVDEDESIYHSLRSAIRYLDVSYSRIVRKIEPDLVVCRARLKLPIIKPTEDENEN